MLHSPSVGRAVPFSSEPPLRLQAARTDLLWTSPEEVSGINKREVAARINVTDVSTIQQFVALLSAEQGDLKECLCVCVWGRGGISVFELLMSDQLPCLFSLGELVDSVGKKKQKKKTGMDLTQQEVMNTAGENQSETESKQHETSTEGNRQLRRWKPMENKPSR